MLEFSPFQGVRYDIGSKNLDDVSAPPYDVINSEQREDLVTKSSYNSVKIELPLPETDLDKYAVAQKLFSDWIKKGILKQDSQNCFYIYKMSYTDQKGQARQTTGVIGALRLSKPGTGNIFPHEQTMPKPKGDRLNILRSCNANLSPVWTLSLAQGLTDYLNIEGEPVAYCQDEDQVLHQMWAVSDPDAIEKISSIVSSQPLIIADGHHRFETALAFQEEQRSQNSNNTGSDFIMTFVVELSEKELLVQPIHRLIKFNDSTDKNTKNNILNILSSYFEVLPSSSNSDKELIEEMETKGSLALITNDKTWLLKPLEKTNELITMDLDSSRLDLVLGELGDHEIRYEAMIPEIKKEIAQSKADLAFLLRAPSIELIADSGKKQLRMPPKSTYFYPKPRTGLVFRLLENN